MLRMPAQAATRGRVAIATHNVRAAVPGGEREIQGGFHHLGNGVEQVALFCEIRSLVGVRARLPVHDLGASGRAIAGLEHGRQLRRMVGVSGCGGDGSGMETQASAMSGN